MCRRRQPGLHKCWPFLPARLRLVDSCKVVFSFSRDALGFKLTFAPSSLIGLGMTVPSWLAKQSLALLSFCLAIDFNGDSLTIAFDKQVCIALNCTGSASGMKYTATGSLKVYQAQWQQDQTKLVDFASWQPNTD